MYVSDIQIIEKEIDNIMRSFNLEVQICGKEYLSFYQVFKFKSKGCFSDLFKDPRFKEDLQNKYVVEIKPNFTLEVYERLFEARGKTALEVKVKLLLYLVEQGLL